MLPWDPSTVVGLRVLLSAGETLDLKRVWLLASVRRLRSRYLATDLMTQRRRKRCLRGHLDAGVCEAVEHGAGFDLAAKSNSVSHFSRGKPAGVIFRAVTAVARRQVEPSTHTSGRSDEVGPVSRTQPAQPRATNADTATVAWLAVSE